jgi:AraC family transcriptional regulator
MNEPRIETLGPKKLVGMRMRMTLADLFIKTPQLWQRFSPRQAEIRERVGTDYVSMQIYEDLGDQGFAPDRAVEKWAAVEVSNQTAVPEGMEPYTISGGKYAVFVHEGPASAAPETFEYIFGTWLPGSGYALDDREHFELLPKSYRPDDPEAREEVWIPIR